MPVNVNSQLVRRNNADFKLVDDGDLGGGYRVVATTVARDAIPSSMLKIGMRAFVQADGKVYKLDQITPTLTWTEDTGGSGLPPFAGVDGAVVVEENNPTPTAVFRRLTLDDIDPAFAVTSFSSAQVANKELGDQIVNPQFSAAYNGALSPVLGDVTLQDSVDTQNVPLPATAFGYGAPAGTFAARSYSVATINGSRSWTLSAKKLGGPIDTAALSANLGLVRAFFGAAAIPGSFNEAFIEGLTGLAGGRLQGGFASNTYAFAANGPGLRHFICLPTGWGSPSSWKDQNNDAALFTKVATGVAVTNGFAVAIPGGYDVWQSDNELTLAFTYTAVP